MIVTTAVSDTTGATGGSLLGKRVRKAKSHYDPGQISEHDKKVSETRRKAKMKSVRDSKKAARRLMAENAFLCEQNRLYDQKLLRSQYELRCLREAYRGDVGISIVAASKSAMPNKHLQTRARAVVRSIADGCLGDEGKWALDVVVRNVM